LFATHYFELTALADQLDGVINVHLSAAEHDGHVVFLHSVRPGPASQSYGLQVAQLAGIPSPVIQAARQKLQQLEFQSAAMKGAQTTSQPQSPAPMVAASLQPDLFATRFPSDVELRLRDVDPDGLTPREAHELIYALKQLL